MSLPSSGIAALRVPGADEHGFVDLPELRRAARRLGAAEFVARYPGAGLWAAVSLPAHVQAGGPEAAGSAAVPQLLTIGHRGLEGLRYHDRVAFLVKRPGNPFPLLVSIGRSVSNDVVMAVDAVSKMHGYFTFAAGVWSFADRSSTNGSMLNGQRLEAERKEPLSPGDQLQLGPCLSLRFETCESLATHLLAT